MGLAVDGFVEVLQAGEGEELGQQVEAYRLAGCFLFHLLPGHGHHLFVVKDEGGHFVDVYPVGVVLMHRFAVVLVDVDEGVVDHRDDPFAGVAVDGTEGVYLLHVEIFETGELGQHPLGGLVDTLAFAHETSHERPLPLGRFHLAFEQEQVERALLETEDDAVYRNVVFDFGMIIRHSLLLGPSAREKMPCGRWRGYYQKYQ